MSQQLPQCAGRINKVHLNVDVAKLLSVLRKTLLSDGLWISSERGPPKTSRQHRLSYRVRTSSSEMMVFSSSAPHSVTTLYFFYTCMGRREPAGTPGPPQTLASDEDVS